MPADSPSRAYGRRVIRWGRLSPGFTVCARCGEIADNATMAMVARPGATKGVWWCEPCTSEVVGDERPEQP